MKPENSSITPCVIAEFTTASDLGNAIAALEKSNFEQENVSIITRSDDADLLGLGRSAAAEPERSSPDKSMASEKTMGGATLAGGAIGAALGTATLIGPLLVAGPILGMAAGAVAGGILSAAEGWGIDRETAESYQSKVDAGSSLIIVSDVPIRLNEANQVLATCNPATLQRFDAK